MPDLTLDELYDKVQVAAKLVKVGGVYEHYKGEDKTYTVLDLVIVEATNDVAVLYRANYDTRLSFIRPVDVWLEQVEWQGRQKPRFRLLTD